MNMYSYLVALLASVVYVAGFIVIHRLTAAKWFALEVLFGAFMGAAGLAMGVWLVPKFHVEYYASLFGVLWFCFFFVSGIFYASISLSIVRYLSEMPGASASIAQMYRDCIEAPFLERAQFLSRVGQADRSTPQQRAQDAHYSISPLGAKNAQRIQLIQRLFGFASTGYYSILEGETDGSATALPSSRFRPSPFLRILSSALVALGLAETCLSHGIRASWLTGWHGIGATLLLGILFFFAVFAATNHLLSAAARAPASWVIWMPLAVILLLAQLGGIRYGAPNIASDWIVLGATLFVVARGLWTMPARSLWPLLLLWVVSVFLWFKIGGSGALHPESADWYFGAYLNKQRPWLDTIFDPSIEFNDNRSRPASLIFDFIDYRLVQASTLMGHPQFRMFTYPAFLFACTGSAYWFFVRELKLTRSLTIVLLMLFESAPAVAFHGLYRTAKFGATLMSIAVLSALYRFIAAAETGIKLRAALPRLAWIWVGCLMMPMFDELGSFTIGILVACMGAYAVFRRTRIAWTLFFTVTSTLLGAYFYRYKISLFLYRTVSRIEIENIYNIDKTLAKDIQLDTLLQTAVEMVVDNFRYVFGNIPRGAAAAMILALAIIVSIGYRVRWGSRANGRPLPVISGLVLLGVVTLVVAEFCIMVHFHPQIVLPEVRCQYYVLPTVALFTMMVPIALKVVCAGHRNVSRTITAVFALWFCGNVDSDFGHYKMIHTGSHAGVFFRRSDEAVAVIKMVQKNRYTPLPGTDPIVTLLLKRN